MRISIQHHLYFGDEHGTPGTVFTCFPVPHGEPGRLGAPQVASAAFVVPADSLEYWQERLAERDVEFDAIRAMLEAVRSE